MRAPPTPLTIVGLLLLTGVLAGCLDHGDPPRYDRTETTLVVEETPESAMFQIDLQRRGYLPDAQVPDEVALDWRVGGINKWTHTAAKGSPVIADERILIGADTGTLYCFDLHGNVLWAAATHPSTNGIHGTPAVHEGVVYVGAYDGAMYAYDLEDGTELWRTQIGGSIGSSPLWYDGKIYVSVETPKPSGIMTLLNATDGEILWTDDDIADHPHSSVALDPEHNVFVVGANDGVLYAWDLDTNERRWTTHKNGAIKGPILLHDGAAYFGSWDGHLHRVDVADGRIDWTFRAGGKIMPGPALDWDTMTIYTGSHDDHVYAVDAETGTQKWRTDVHGWVIGSLLVAGDKVLAGSYDGRLYALDKTDGTIHWSFKTVGRVTSTPAIISDRVVFAERAGDGAGSLWVIGPGGTS